MDTFTKCFTLGFDRGNSETNVASLGPNGQLDEIADTSMISEDSRTALENIRQGSGFNDHALNENFLELGDNVYFVGDVAERQGKNYTTEFGDKRRYFGTLAQVSLLTYATQIAWRRFPGCNEFCVGVV